MPAIMLGTVERILDEVGVGQYKKPGQESAQDAISKEKRHRTLVMFSGGKDSFVSACRCIDRGDEVALISFNNGALAAEKNLLHGAMRIISRYGPQHVSYAGVYNTAAFVARLRKWHANQSYEELQKVLPSVCPTQVMCLHCQTAMWASAIAYAKAQGYDTICSGCRHSDEFCTGSVKYLDAIRELAKYHFIDVLLPVWEPSSSIQSWDIERDCEMTDRGFEPQVLEPKCMLGMPCSKLTEKQEGELLAYYKKTLEPVVLSQMGVMVNIFKYIKLSPLSLQCPDYPCPEGGEGYY